MPFSDVIFTTFLVMWIVGVVCFNFYLAFKVSNWADFTCLHSFSVGLALVVVFGLFAFEGSLIVYIFS